MIALPPMPVARIITVLCSLVGVGRLIGLLHNDSEANVRREQIALEANLRFATSDVHPGKRRGGILRRDPCAAHRWRMAGLSAPCRDIMECAWTREVAKSADWQTRISRGFGFRHPRGWRWDVTLRERASELEEWSELTLRGCDPDIAFARSFVEQRRARLMVAKSASEMWCLGLSLFDARAIEGLPFVFKRLGGEAGIRERSARRDERKLHYDWQVFLSDVQKEGAVLTDRAVVAGRYAHVPHCWDAYEVLWVFLPESPRSALLWELRISVSLFRAADTAAERGAVAHALWEIILSQWAQNVASDLFAEAYSAWNIQEAGDEGRLWWLPGCHIQGMKQIGERALFRGYVLQGKNLNELLDTIPQVR